MNTRGADKLVDALRQVGADCVFGLPGTQNVALYEALRTSSLRSVVATSELSAAMMANGYYRASGRPGVVLTIPGPGFAWALPGIAEAALDSAALLHITGAPATAPGSHFQLQAFNQTSVAAPLYKAVFSVEHIGELGEALVRAYRLSLEGEPGPVLLQISQRPDGGSPIESRWPEKEMHSPLSNEEAIATTALALNRARRCVLLLGQGCHGAAESALRLAERLHAAVITTTSGRGVLAEDHPLSLGFECSGNNVESLNALIESCDQVLAVGCKFSHNGSRGFRLRIPQEKLIHVDASEEVLGANYPARLVIRADARRFLQDLCVRLEEADPSRGFEAGEMAQWKRRATAEKLEGVIEPRIHGVAAGAPAAFFGALRRALPRDSILVTDSGQHQDLARRHFPVWSARGLITPTNLQSMGFGIGAAIGAKLAAPDRPVVALIGDGGLGMSGLELLTAVREGLSLTVIVFVDGAYGAIRNQQRAAHGHAFGTQLGAVDCKALAAALGARYVRFESEPDNTLHDALGNQGVTLVEVRVGDSLPMRWSQAKGLAKDLLGRKS